MKGPTLKHVVYQTLYPRPTKGEPSSWADFVNRCIVPEVREETHRFYGPIDDLESKYPGLDYAAPAYRLRLRQFPHHRALFAAFDRLGLTYWEIYELCKWEGTKNAKDKYMKHNNVMISDTTWDGIKYDNRPSLPLTSYRAVHRRQQRKEIQVDGACDSPAKISPSRSTTNSTSTQARTPTLNRRVRAVTAAHLQGQPLPLDPAYEQWLKESREVRTSSRRREEPAFFPPPSGSPYSSHRSRPQSQLSSSPPFGAEYSPSPSQLPYPRGGYDGSSYWTQTVPDMIQYGTRTTTRPPSSAFPHVIESARRMMGEASPPAPRPGHARPSAAAAPTSPSESRRSRRR